MWCICLEATQQQMPQTSLKFRKDMFRDLEAVYFCILQNGKVVCINYTFQATILQGYKNY